MFRPSYGARPSRASFFADFPAEEREARGISERFLPISVGIENVKDPIADLEQAFGTTNNE